MTQFFVILVTQDKRPLDGFFLAGESAGPRELASHAMDAFRVAYPAGTSCDGEDACARFAQARDGLSRTPGLAVWTTTAQLLANAPARGTHLLPVQWMNESDHTCELDHIEPHSALVWRHHQWPTGLHSGLRGWFANPGHLLDRRQCNYLWLFEDWIAELEFTHEGQGIGSHGAVHYCAWHRAEPSFPVLGREFVDAAEDIEDLVIRLQERPGRILDAMAEKFQTGARHHVE